MHLGHGQFVNRLRTRASSKNYVTNSSYGEGSDISLTAGFECSRKKWIADSQYNLFGLLSFTLFKPHAK